jgi:hypothetical protein
MLQMAGCRRGDDMDCEELYCYSYDLLEHWLGTNVSFNTWQKLHIATVHDARTDGSALYHTIPTHRNAEGWPGQAECAR